MSNNLKQRSTESTESSLPERSRHSRLLLVEDNNSMRLTLAEIMESEGFKVTACETAEEALLKLSQQDFGIAIVDQRLPGMQGTGLLNEIRKLKSKVRVIINTAYGELQSAKAAINCGAFSYLEKANDPSELISEVHRAFRSHYERYTDDLESAVAKRTKELSESESRLRLVFENSPVCIWYEDFSAVKVRLDELRGIGINDFQSYFNANPKTIHDCVSLVKILDVNSAALTLHEATNKDELLGSLTRIFVDESYPVFSMELAALANGETTFVSDAVVKTLSGEKKHVMMRLFVDQSAPDWSRVFIALMDITDRKNAERELEIARSAAEVANLAKSRFLANMSHEIRTPMTAILGYADILLEPNLPETERALYVNTIHRSGKALLAIINDILDLSKIEAGKFEVEHNAFHPLATITETTTLMNASADAKGLSLEVEYVGVIPDTIQSDEKRLRQMLVNVIGNAIKFTDSGSVRLVTQLVNIGEATQLQFDVIDTGRGMTQEQANKVFTPFTQADASITRIHGGTGLGLTISKRFAELLGGDIIITDSVPGSGSAFRITVPTGSLKNVSMLENPGSIPMANNHTRPADRAALHGMRILLAEDHPDNQLLIDNLLTKAGAEVVVVENGQLALDAALAARDDDHQFNVVLMDIQMPVMDGYEATEQLRQCGYSGAIIAITAHAMSGDRERCLNAGCEDYATKPINRDKFITMIAKHSSLAALS